VDELCTPRLRLRPWREEDLEPFAALNADPVVMEHFPAVLSRSGSNALAMRIRKHVDEHGYGLWAVDVDDVFAGFTGLMWSDVTGVPALEVGWRLSQRFWGRGLATEAATAALAYGLEREPRVVSFTAAGNERSWRVMERIGMRPEGEFDHPRADLPDRLRRHVLYASP
jgi:3-dehydroquinate dehydratase/shikimate dehydrogenase